MKVVTAKNIATADKNLAGEFIDCKLISPQLGILSCLSFVFSRMLVLTRQTRLITPALAKAPAVRLLGPDPLPERA